MRGRRRDNPVLEHTDVGAPQQETTMFDSKEVKKGGFGRFEETYRDRWAEGHPETGRKAPPAISPEPTTPAEPAAVQDSKV
jgi:hypothetical protein